MNYLIFNINSFLLKLTKIDSFAFATEILGFWRYYLYSIIKCKEVYTLFKETDMFSKTKKKKSRNNKIKFRFT